MLEKTNKLVLLFDFYGVLLTPRQRDIFKLYYYEDFSLGEISEIEGVSRQAIMDQIKRGEELLFDYEDKLGLVASYENQRKNLQKIKAMLEHPVGEQERKKCLELLEEMLRSEA